MSKCIQCGAEYEAKRADSRYCGPTCRSRASRGNSATDPELSVAAADKAAIHATVATLTATDTQPLHPRPVDILAKVFDDGWKSRHELNARARGVNQINTGPWMSAAQLSEASTKAKCNVINRVSLPGDHDSKGVCKEVDGVWRVA